MVRDVDGKVKAGSLARIEPEGKVRACGKRSKPIWNASSR
jgi:hypothetical protein